MVVGIVSAAGWSAAIDAQAEAIRPIDIAEVLFFTPLFPRLPEDVK
jgi:hypothetical protein